MHAFSVILGFYEFLSEIHLSYALSLSFLFTHLYFHSPSLLLFLVALYMTKKNNDSPGPCARAVLVSVP